MKRRTSDEAMIERGLRKIRLMDLPVSDVCEGSLVEDLRLRIAELESELWMLRKRYPPS